MVIGFSTSKYNLFSAFIRFMTKSKASHTYISFKSYDQDLVLQADILGIDINYYQNTLSKHKIIAAYQVDLSPDKEKEAMSFALSKLAKPYDYLAILGFGWVLLGRLLGKKFKNPLALKGSYFCSEFVVDTLCAAGVSGMCELDASTISPEDLIELLNNKQETKNIQSINI